MLSSAFAYTSQQMQEQKLFELLLQTTHQYHAVVAITHRLNTSRRTTTEFQFQVFEANASALYGDYNLLALKNHIIKTIHLKIEKTDLQVLKCTVPFFCCLSVCFQFIRRILCNNIQFS